MSRQTRASVNTCIVLGVSSAGSERIDFGRGGARRWRNVALHSLLDRWRAAMAWTSAAMVCRVRVRVWLQLQRCSVTG